MAVLSLAQFANRLRVTDYTFEPSENVQTTQSIGGITYRVSRGPILWSGSITCSAYTHDGQAQLSALIDKIKRPGNQFLFTPPKSTRPKSFVAGNNLSSVQIDGVQASGYDIKLKRLPPNFVLTEGDYFSFNLNGIHRIYRVVTAVTASATGTATVEVNIPLASGGLPANNTAVALINPLVTCQYKDRSYSGVTVGLSHSDSFSFSFVQTIRI